MNSSGPRRISPQWKGMVNPSHQVFHSARDLRAWLERGEGDGEEVFTNTLLRERRCKNDPKN